MIPKHLKPITETKYLSAENTWRYRGIMRTFYIFDQQYRHWLNKDEVFEALSKEASFQDYTPEQCRQDLDILVGWGNLSAVQDSSKVTTYQQFVNKQFRYQMTAYAIEIERMTLRLENILIEGGSLEPTLLERIVSEVKQFKAMTQVDDQQAGAWWSLLSADFQRLNQNYQDYIREWYSIKAEELMKSRSFLAYKEKLIEYLRHFIKELQHHAFEIERVLKALTLDERRLMVEKISRYEFEIPRLELEEISYEAVEANIDGKMNSFFNFFISRESRESEVETILGMSNEVIRRITRSAANILEASGQFSSRKEEYRHMSKMFMETESIREAHLLAGMLFGISGYKHFQTELTRETESIYSSIHEEPPFEIVTQPRVRTYKERMEKSGIIDRAEEKSKMRERILIEKAMERQALEAYIQAGKLDLAALGEIPAFVRHAILRWLANAMQEKSHESRTEFGTVYRVVNPETRDRCLLKSPDGQFELPAYQLIFEV